MKPNTLQIGLWLACLFGALQMTCAADPWPEPDDMQKTNEPDDKDTGDEGSGGEAPAEGDDEEKDGDEHDLDNDEIGEETDEAPSGGDTDTQAPSGDTAFDTGQLEGTDTEDGDDSDGYSDGSGTDSRNSQSTDTGGEIEGGGDSGDTREDTDMDSVPDWGADAGAGTDADVGDASAALSQVYCSAPGPSGAVTVVGLAGTVLRQGQVEAVHGGESYAMTVGSDGGFVGRFSAGPREPVEIVVRFADSEQERITLMTGSLENGFAGTGITGANGTVTKLPDEDQVIIHGQGERLDTNHLVIGGNLDAATGRGAPVSCADTICTFDLLIPGQTGDDVDVFMVPIGKHWGSSDSQTVRIQ